MDAAHDYLTFSPSPAALKDQAPNGVWTGHRNPSRLMRGLTVSQPWASRIADGTKLLENRTWPTSYRGLLAIHAGKGTQFLTKSELRQYPSGIVAVVRLVDVVEVERIWDGSYPVAPEQQGHASGPFCWVLRDVVALHQPLPYKGAMGLWSVDAATVQILRKYC